MRDGDLRAAVLKKVLAEHIADPRTRVVEELGLQHGARRVDIAVVNGVLHGYELKSELDTLDRLPGQIDAYSLVFDRATLVTTHKHLKEARAFLPAWWGIKLAERGSRGALHIKTIRRVGENPGVSPFHVAQLLWRPEAIAILLQRGIDIDVRRMNKAALYRLLVDSVSVTELRGYVRDTLKCRTNWRDPAPHA